MSISTCAVTGNVKNLLNSNVQNCTVKASVLTPFFHSGSWISGELASTVTDSAGNFTLTVIETATVGKKVSFTFEYSDGVGGIRTRKYTVIVPNTTTITLSDLVTADESPVTANTFPASSVTVVPVGGLTSDTAQEALEELQGDIDAITTLTDGKIYIGNAADAATEVTPSGDVTIANDGTTAISAGVIVNADVSASAAIEYSKLNLSSAIVNADVSAAAAIAYSKLNLATSIVNADVAAAAAIARTKIASGTNYRILANDSSGVMSENVAITASRAVASDANGQLVASATTATELGYVNGVTSAIQTQLNTKTGLDSNSVIFFAVFS